MGERSFPLIVSFVGPVGVGKSTQIQLLANYLRSRNKKTVIIYLKSAHGTTNVLSYIVKKLVLVNKNVVTHRDGFQRNFYIRIAPLWNFSETISIVGKFFFSVFIPFSLGYNVLIEEGLIMSIENFELFRPFLLGVKPTKLPFLDVLLRWIRANSNLDILLDAEENDVDARRKSRSFRRTESKDYLELQRKVMSNLRGSKFLLVKTSGKSIQDVHQAVVNYFEKNYF
jgi:hypothetical protein